MRPYHLVEAELVRDLAIKTATDPTADPAHVEAARSRLSRDERPISSEGSTK